MEVLDIYNPQGQPQAARQAFEALLDFWSRCADQLALQRVVRDNFICVPLDLSRIQQHQPPTLLTRPFEEALFAYPLIVMPAASAALHVHWSLNDNVRVRLLLVSAASPVSAACVTSDSVGRLVCAEGLVRRVGPVKAKITSMNMICMQCETSVTVVASPDGTLPGAKCKNKACRQCPLAPSRRTAKAVDVQLLHLHAAATTLTDDVLDVRLEGPIANVCRPGDHVLVWGVVNTAQSRTGLFSLFLDAVSVASADQPHTPLTCPGVDDKCWENFNKPLPTPTPPTSVAPFIRDFWQEERDKFAALAASLCPSLCGLESAKAAALLSLLGGVAVKNEAYSTRGTVHLLLFGAPDSGKSTLLRAVADVARHSVIVPGRSSTGALLAAVSADTDGDLHVDAGGLVLASGGHCCIDELDKASTGDRTAVETAMEDGLVVLVKGELVCRLEANTSVVATANLAQKGSSSSLPHGTIARFDLAIRLEEEGHDSLSNRLSAVRDLVPRPLLAEYIAYARQHAKPSVTPAAAVEVTRIFEFLQQKAPATRPVSFRTLESLIRLAQARAKVDLSNEVTVEHVHDVEEVLSSSLLGELHRQRLDDNCRTATGKKTRGMGISALLTPFQRQLQSVLSDTGNLTASRAATLAVAKDVISACGGGVTADQLVEAANELGLLLQVGPGLYKIL